MGDKNPIRTLGDYSILSHEGYRNTIKLPEGNNVHDPSPHGRILLPDSLLNSFYQRTIDQSAGGKLRDFNPEESWTILVDLALYDNESWNDLRDFAKPVKAITLPQDDRILKFNSLIESLGLVPPSPNAKLVCTKEKDGDVMFIEIIPKDDDSRKEELEAEGQEMKYSDIFPTRSELAYHKYLMCGPIPSIFLRNPIIMGECHSHLKIPCNIRHVHVENTYIDLNYPINVMTRMMYNWIMKKKLDPRENANGGISNFMGRIKEMHVFIGNFTYVIDFMIIEDISSILDPRLSQVVLGRPFIEISNMTHDPPEVLLDSLEGSMKLPIRCP
nr:MAK10-like protein [Tanacetum cinerariifolium]